MKDKNNKAVSDVDKNKKVEKIQRRVSEIADNPIVKSLKPYIEMNKKMSKFAQPYVVSKNIVPKKVGYYSALNKLKGSWPTANTALQNYLKQTKVNAQKFNPVLPANTALQKHLQRTGVVAQKFNPVIPANTALQKYLQQTKIDPRKFRSAMSVNTVWQEYLKKSARTANIYRDAIKPFKTNTIFSKNYSQIAKVSDRFQKLVERTLGKHSENLKVATILMKNGWVTSEFFYNSVLKDNYDKSETEILEYIERFYTENNYQRFYRVFDLVIEGFEEQNLNEGYRLLLVKIRKLIKQDFDNYDLFMNLAFSIVEYLCCFKFGILSTNDFIKERSISTARQKYADINGQLTEIDIMSMFGVLKSWWKNIKFKKGLDRTDFGRSPIEHGRYDPRRYKRTDFIKLVLVMFNVLMAPDPDLKNR